MNNLRGLIKSLREPAQAGVRSEAIVLLEVLFESSPDALVVTDADGRIMLVNAELEKRFGYERTELIGKSVELLVRGAHEHYRASCMENPQSRPTGSILELSGCHRDGTEFPLDIKLSPLHLPSGTRILAVVRDITEHKAVQKALHEEKERSQVTLNSIGDAVLSTDSLGNINYLNKVAEALTGWSLAEAAGMPLAHVFQTLDRDAADVAASSLLSPEGTETLPASCYDYVLVRRGGGHTPIEATTAPIHDASGELTGAVIVFHDATKSQALTKKMSHLAQHDYLTNLPNRMVLNDRLHQAVILARRRRSKLALLFLDLDRFKHINDSLGHGIGDQLLKSVAERLKSCVRGMDTVSRQGGDEFIILLPDIKDAADAALVAEKVNAALSTAHRIARHDLYISASIGISIFPDDGSDAETLVKNADAAMYHAKDHGRGNYQFFAGELNLRSEERQALESGLRRALEREEFELYFQPKFDLASGVANGVEAFLRWRRPEHGIVYPSSFISIAEESGLIQPIGRWVMREACKFQRDWQGAGLPAMPVSINISTPEFRAEWFVENVRLALDEFGVDPRSLELELTEGALLRNPETAHEVMNRLKLLGVRLTIDNFGIGNSSLNSLSHFPIDTVKMDQSLIRDVTLHPDRAAIVGAVIGMCEGLDCRVVAEGVETPEQVEMLRSRHCAEAQGNYFCRPLAVDEFTHWLVGGQAANVSAQPMR